MTYNVGNPQSAEDDPTNTSGLGAPAIIRGTIYANKISGLVVGSGQSTATQQANATALQNAINYAASNEKFFEIPPGVYQINNSAGLVIPWGKFFVWRGDMYNTQIEQHYATSPGAPVLTIGDPTGTNISSFFDVEGVNLLYAADQTGFASSQCLLLGDMYGSRIKRIGVNGNEISSYPAYNSVAFVHGDLYSNSFEDWNVWDGQNYGMYINYVSGTGNHWSNIYMRSSGSPSNNMVYLGGAVDRFDVLNIEGGTCNQILKLANCMCTFNNLHLEDNVLKSSSATLIEISNSMADFDTVTIFNPVLNTTNITSGIGAMIQTYASSPSVVNVKNLTVYTFNNTAVTMNFVVHRTTNFSVGSTSGQPQTNSAGAGSMTISNIQFKQGGGSTELTNYLNVDLYQPRSGSAFLTPSFASRYEWGQAGSRLWGALLNVSATYTHYGMLEEATIVVPATITSFTITLADTMGSSGTEKPRTGARVHITRVSGTMSGTLTVNDGGGGTLLTNTVSGGFDFQFNGSAWVQITGVSPSTSLI